MYGANIQLADSEAELVELKKRFAYALLHRPDEPYLAAIDVFGDINPGKSMYASQWWIADPVVTAEMARLKTEHGSLSFLPNKETVCRKAWDTVKEAKTVAERISAMRLYSELMEFNPKPTGGANQNVFVGGNGGSGGARVMVVTAHGNDEEWKEAAKNQQARLLEEAAEDLKELPTNVAAE